MSIVRCRILVFGRLLVLVVLSWISTVPPACATPFSPESQASPALTRFTSTVNQDVSLRFVSDSGVCETTPGVHQMSGYIDVGMNMSMVRLYSEHAYLWCSIFCLRAVVLVLWSPGEPWHCPIYSLVCIECLFCPPFSDLFILSLAKVERRPRVFFNDWSLPRKWALYS